MEGRKEEEEEESWRETGSVEEERVGTGERRTRGETGVMGERGGGADRVDAVNHRPTNNLRWLGAGGLDSGGKTGSETSCDTHSHEVRLDGSDATENAEHRIGGEKPKTRTGGRSRLVSYEFMEHLSKRTGRVHY